MKSRLAITSAVASALASTVASGLVAGCLSVPDEQPVECKSNADCDTANGEVCEENVCWGNPPPGPFAALIAPPIVRKDELVPYETLLSSIPSDGYFGDLVLDAAVTYSGQVVCPSCGNEMLAARIEVTRPSTFPGGPNFRQVFSTDPRTGTFQLVLPPVRPGEPEYAVTIIPEGRSANDPPNTMAKLVPPLRTQLALETNQTGKTFDLGGQAPLITVAGEIVDIQDNPASSYRVVALGRFDASSPLTEVSTVHFIDGSNNTFSVRLSEGIVGDVEIVAQPFGPVLQPTLRLAGISTQIPVENLQLVIPSLGAVATSQEIKIAVEGTVPGGQVAPVIGAHVTVTGSVTVGDTTATVLVEGDSDNSGNVLLQVPGGAFLGTYHMSIVPQASSTVGVVFDQPIEVGAHRIKLPDRVAIAGVVVDVDGNPLEGVTVTAVPSLRFLWSLSNQPQKFLSAIPSSTAVTLNTGEFVLHIDPALPDAVDAVYAHYDLVFAPKESSNAPTWTVFDIEIPRTSMLSQIVLNPTVLPDAAHIHGRIIDPFGNALGAAELKLFRVPDPQLVEATCSSVPNAPLSCPIPATLLGRGVSDTSGIARLTLPR